jgi:hypothetical protein
MQQLLGIMAGHRTLRCAGPIAYFLAGCVADFAMFRT